MKHLERALDNQNQWWKYTVTFLGFLAGYFIGSLPLLGLISYNIAKSGGTLTGNPSNPADMSAYGIDSNVGLVLMMLPFLTSLLFIVLLLKPLHKRTLSEVINGRDKIRWSRFFLAFGLWALLMGIYTFIDFNMHPDNFTVRFDAAVFFPLVIISLLIIPFQTTLEELLFRGYVAQGVAAWTKSRWLVIIIPGVLFGLMHSANPEVKASGFVLAMSQYIFFGLLFGLITTLDDGIETTMGAHAANNIFFAIFITNKSSALQTAALLEQHELFPVRELILLLVIGFAFLWLLSLRYKWNFSILKQKIITSGTGDNISAV
jgi:membrane protease YdiL (CAAX protease family)